MDKALSYGAAFILGVGAGWVIQGRHWDVFLTSYIPALATLLAAFYGAKYAFQFQKDKEVEDIKRRNLVNANIAIHALSRMANKLFIYQRDFINPVRTSPAIFIELRPSLILEKDLIRLNVDALYFLLETEHRNLLGEVIIEEDRYRSAIDAINARSHIHQNEVQPILEKMGFVQGSTYTFNQIEQFLGSRLYTTIQQTTQQLIEHVDSTLASLQKVGDKLTIDIKSLYPNQTVIGFKLPG